MNVGFMKYDGVDMKGQRTKSEIVTSNRKEVQREEERMAFGKFIGKHKLLYNDAMMKQFMEIQLQKFLHNHWRRY